ncbi:molybdopterin-dependent oxidoreductase [Microbacterium sp. ARD31]|uniref:molybdopterin-dependent oxidoreductase n=1 Tax=Microbacterium sp. ARD31 TaxID=2962576 RepID=UPI002882B90F|nr:molybdopterin-dependent oxidoreductase [Microbacterium sp. ARD31]MDT0188233.1 molybdopterin-dependent oxidoreductase [Microbacterium sp. ARD31]
MRDWFPRFGNRPQAPPPPTRPVELRIDGLGVAAPFVATQADLDRLPQREQVSDFHCVTTWTVRGLRWTGVPMRDFWHEVVVPRLDPAVDFAVVEARGGDGYKVVLLLEDLLGDEVLLARELDGSPLDARHGAPLRLVSPPQYGYKSVKHLTGLRLRGERPPGRLEHLRGRVALEERHDRVPGWLLRWPYRALIVPTATRAERSLRAPSRG